MQDDLINFSKGIRFECQGSGRCCVSRGSYGLVYLGNVDLRRFSKYFNLSLKEFKKKYCQITDGFIHLTEKEEQKGNCIFLKDKMCTVYKSRPSQCRTWPFWNDNMNTKVWNQDISVNCPGIGKGKLISHDKINKFLKEDLDNEKSILKNRVNPAK